MKTSLKSIAVMALFASPLVVAVATVQATPKLLQESYLLEQQAPVRNTNRRTELALVEYRFNELLLAQRSSQEFLTPQRP